MSEERRKRSLTDEDVAALLLAFEGAHCIPTSEHKSHHDFISVMVEKERAKHERWEKIRTQVSGWAIISLLGAIGTAGYQALQYIKDHWK